MNTSGFLLNLLLHDEHYKMKHDKLVKSQGKDFPRCQSSPSSHSNKLQGALMRVYGTIWEFLPQETRH